MSGKEAIGDVILREALGADEATSKTPTVLSCGGIYIPRTNREQRIIYHVITTSRAEEPVKILTGLKPRNILHEILLKESLN